LSTRSAISVHASQVALTDGRQHRAVVVMAAAFAPVIPSSNPVGQVYRGVSTLLCTPNSLSPLVAVPAVFTASWFA
jgi:hypothetical protein